MSRNQALSPFNYTAYHDRDTWIAPNPVLARPINPSNVFDVLHVAGAPVDLSRRQESLGHAFEWALPKLRSLSGRMLTLDVPISSTYRPVLNSGNVPYNTPERNVQFSGKLQYVSTGDDRQASTGSNYYTFYPHRKEQVEAACYLKLEDVSFRDPQSVFHIPDYLYWAAIPMSTIGRIGIGPIVENR